MASETGTLVERLKARGEAIRLRLKRPPKDSTKLDAAWPVVLSRIAWLALLIAALAVLAYETGKPSTSSSGFVHSLLIALTKPAVSIPLASLLVLGIASSFRRLWLERLVRNAGAIAVNELTVPAGTCDVDDAARLSMTFRRRLMQLRLQAPTPVPGATPAEDFLAMVDREQLDAKNLLGSVVSLLRAAIPTHGFEVSAALVYEPSAPPERPRYGVTAQVIRLPNEAIPIDTAWASSWEDAITTAADMVTAAVLPRTRLSNKPPWSGWRRYPMPPTLVHHFEKAEELTGLRRYDEALDNYFRALALDPKNVDLRLHKGFVEEKLGLYVDAVATYVAAQKIGEETSSRLYHRGARRNREASGRIARYRFAILLGGGKFAHQWRKESKNSLRDRQRWLLRERLESELVELLERAGLTGREDGAKGGESQQNADGAPHWPREYLKTLLADFCTAGGDGSDPRYYELRQVFGWLARRELEALQDELRHRAGRTSLSPLAAHLTIAGLDVRLGYVKAKLAQLNGGAEQPKPQVDVEHLERVLKASGQLTWSDHYNAACLYALPLLVENVADDEALSMVLAERAVVHLSDAMSSTVSWYAAQRRDWVLSEDPDLDGLRERTEFKTFEAVYFPSPSRTPQRPRRVHRWEQSRYTHSLLSQTARRWETIWHERRDVHLSSVDPHVVMQWCADEAEAWRLVERLAKDYRHWRVRHDLIEQMKTWSDRYAFARIMVEVPRYAPANGADGDDLELLIDQEIDGNERRLCEVLAVLGTMNGQQARANGRPGTGAQRSALERLQAQLRDPAFWSRVASTARLEPLQHHQLERLQKELRNRDFWHRAPPRMFLPSVCDVHAAMWQRLHEWLEETPYEDRRAGDAFAGALSQAAHLSGTFHGLWLLAVLERRMHLVTSGSRRSNGNGGSRPQTPSST